MRPRRCRGPTGFTIVEILTTLAVMGVLLTMVVPRIDRERFRLDAQVQSLGFVLNAAQRLAVLKQHDVVLTFEVDQRRMQLLLDRNNSRTADNGEKIRYYPLEDGVNYGLGSAPALSWGSKPVTFPEVAGEPTLTFHRNGSASSFGAIYLNSPDGKAKHARAIEVERATGEVRCQSYREGSWGLTC